MKRIITTFLTMITMFINGFSQEKNFIDQPYLETSAKVDTLVQPDLIYIDILITEKDTRNRESVEELESKMALKLQSLGVNIDKRLILSDLSSNFKKYFLQQKDVLKSKSYELEVYDAITAGKVLVGLEEVGISNVNLNRTEYSKIEDLKLQLKSKAILKAKIQAESLVRPLNQTISGILYISDKLNRNYDNYNNAELDEVVIVGYGGQKKGDPQPIAIEFKKIKVESQIEVKFKIE
jgi:uncharacterized protein YggE